MPEQRINTYEGFFLFPQAAATDLQAAIDLVQQILNRGNAEVLSFSKWDERRLAYEIKGNKRGIYFLAYFKAPADRIPVMERDCNLSEQMLRFMITRADFVPQEIIEASDGRSRLADEIRLRSEKVAAGTEETSRIGRRSEAETAVVDGADDVDDEIVEPDDE